MKKILLLAGIAFTAFSQAQVVKMPAPSSTQTIVQDFGAGKIELTYSRPNIKERSLFKVNSDLAPLDKLWRLGANAATKINFSDNVTMGGKLLDTGTYVIYAIPGKEYWDIILNKGLTNWGTDGYKESEDVVRIKVKSQKINIPVETFTMIFGEILPESCNLTILWGTTAVIVPISTNIRTRLRAQIEKDLSADNVKPAAYQSAANFYLEWDKDLSKALVNAKKATAANPKAFYLYLLEAKIEKEAGDKMAAKISAQKCIELATIAKNEDYIKQANDLIKKL